MQHVFQHYAQYAFVLEEGSQSPPKPKKTLQRLFAESTFGHMFVAARDHFIQQHKEIFLDTSDLNWEEEFEKLYNVGVLAFAIEVKEEFPLLVKTMIDVWDGFKYVDVNTVMYEIFDFDTKQEF